MKYALHYWLSVHYIIFGWFPSQRTSNAELWCFLIVTPKLLNKQLVCISPTPCVIPRGLLQTSLTDHQCLLFLNHLSCHSLLYSVMTQYPYPTQSNICGIECMLAVRLIHKGNTESFLSMRLLDKYMIARTMLK